MRQVVLRCAVAASALGEPSPPPAVVQSGLTARVAILVHQFWLHSVRARANAVASRIVRGRHVHYGVRRCAVFDIVVVRVILVVFVHGVHFGGVWIHDGRFGHDVGVLGVLVVIVIVFFFADDVIVNDDVLVRRAAPPTAAARRNAQSAAKAAQL